MNKKLGSHAGVLKLVKDWDIQISKIVKTEDSLWIVIENIYREQFAWTEVSIQWEKNGLWLRNIFSPILLVTKTFLSINRTGNMQKGHLLKLKHEIFQRRCRIEKDQNPGSGITSKYIYCIPRKKHTLKQCRNINISKKLLVLKMKGYQYIKIPANKRTTGTEIPYK